MSDSKLVGLTSIGNGTAEALFALELTKVLANIDDPNCRRTAKRSITITVDFAPREKSDEIVTTVGISSKLATREPTESTIYMGQQDGALVAVTYNPVQRSLLPDEQDDSVLPMNKKAQNG